MVKIELIESDDELERDQLHKEEEQQEYASHHHHSKHSKPAHRRVASSIGPIRPSHKESVRALFGYDSPARPASPRAADAGAAAASAASASSAASGLDSIRDVPDDGLGDYADDDGGAPALPPFVPFVPKSKAPVSTTPATAPAPAPASTPATSTTSSTTPASIPTPILTSPRRQSSTQTASGSISFPVPSSTSSSTSSSSSSEFLASNSLAQALGIGPIDLSSPSLDPAPAPSSSAGAAAVQRPTKAPADEPPPLPPFVPADPYANLKKQYLASSQQQQPRGSVHQGSGGVTSPSSVTRSASFTNSASFAPPPPVTTIITSSGTSGTTITSFPTGPSAIGGGGVSATGPSGITTSSVHVGVVPNLRRPLTAAPALSRQKSVPAQPAQPVPVTRGGRVRKQRSKKDMANDPAMAQVLKRLEEIESNKAKKRERERQKQIEAEALKRRSIQEMDRIEDALDVRARELAQELHALSAAVEVNEFAEITANITHGDDGSDDDSGASRARVKSPSRGVAGVVSPRRGNAARASAPLNLEQARSSAAAGMNRLASRMQAKEQFIQQQEAAARQAMLVQFRDKMLQERQRKEAELAEEQFFEQERKNIEKLEVLRQELQRERERQMAEVHAAELEVQRAREEEERRRKAAAGANKPVELKSTIVPLKPITDFNRVQNEEVKRIKVHNWIERQSNPAVAREVPLVAVQVSHTTFSPHVPSASAHRATKHTGSAAATTASSSTSNARRSAASSSKPATKPTAAASATSPPPKPVSAGRSSSTALSAAPKPTRPTSSTGLSATAARSTASAGAKPAPATAPAARTARSGVSSASGQVGGSKVALSTH